MTQVAVLVGSLRRESINKKLAQALARLVHSRLQFTFVEIGDLPLFSEDLEAAPPPEVLRLRAQIASAEAVLFVTPEYNRSIPAVLKNAIDWVSRPYGQNGWASKPGAVVGASLGVIGTAAAQAHLRSILSVLDVRLLGQPEVYLHYRPGLMDDDGEIADPATQAFLQGWADRFVAFIRDASEHRAAA